MRTHPGSHQGRLDSRDTCATLSHPPLPLSLSTARVRRQGSVNTMCPLSLPEYFHGALKATLLIITYETIYSSRSWINLHCSWALALLSYCFIPKEREVTTNSMLEKLQYIINIKDSNPSKPSISDCSGIVDLLTSGSIKSIQYWLMQESFEITQWGDLNEKPLRLN